MRKEWLKLAILGALCTGLMSGCACQKNDYSEESEKNSQEDQGTEQSNGSNCGC